jgi:plastocyanin
MYLVVLTIFLFSVPATSLPANASPLTSVSTYTVTIGGDLPHAGGEGMYMGYNPSVIVIRAGDTIVWKALDGPHTVSSENLTADGKPLFDSNPKVQFPLPAVIFGPGGFIPPGGTYTLDTGKLEPGTYGILCTVHADEGMQGTLTVTNETASPGSQFVVVTGYSSGTSEVDQFVPKDVTVPHGTLIIFANLAGVEVHTVASVVTLANGTKVLGTVFDSSPMMAPPGITMDDLPKVNMAGVDQLGGAMFPMTGLDTISYTFNDPGTYLYYCKYHALVENGNIAGMVGEVVVLPSYAGASDLSNLSAQNAQLSSQLATATTLAIGGIALGIVGILLAIWAVRRRAA